MIRQRVWMVGVSENWQRFLLIAGVTLGRARDVRRIKSGPLAGLYGLRITPRSAAFMASLLSHHDRRMHAAIVREFPATGRVEIVPI